MQHRVRPLTHDERKAAEAAFQGAPFDPKWSDAARKIYLGLSSAVANQRQNAFANISLSKPKRVTKTVVQETKTRSRAETPLW